MHLLSCVLTLRPDMCSLSVVEKYFAAQSLDNQILIYSTDNFRQNHKKMFARGAFRRRICVSSRVFTRWQVDQQRRWVGQRRILGLEDRMHQIPA